MADDHLAVEVRHHHGQPAQHPPGRLNDGIAIPLALDEVTVEDRPKRLEREDLFPVEFFRQPMVKVSRLMLQ